GNLVLRQIVRMNQIIAGVVNSNRSHFEAAIADLAALKRKFPSVMGQVIGSRIPVRDFAAAAAALTAKDREKIKVVLTF
ncbi:MAG: glucose dehydrogenase, partial [Planctomycetes bacterium]|nr:glucose dehydrogenase [Planctomycetota bacterium]